MKTGDWLNTALAKYPCPKCGRREKLDVFELVAAWRCCGYVLELPPLHTPLQGRKCLLCAERRQKLRRVAA